MPEPRRRRASATGEAPAAGGWSGAPALRAADWGRAVALAEQCWTAGMSGIILQAAGQAVPVLPYEALANGAQVLVEAVAAKRVEESAPLTTPTAWQSCRSDFNKDDEQLTLCDLPPSAVSCLARLAELNGERRPARSTLPFLVPFTWLVFAAAARLRLPGICAARSAPHAHPLHCARCDGQAVWRRLLNSIQAFDLPDRRESASPPQPAPPPATLLPVYVMLPLDTVWPVERDGRKVRPGFDASLCTAMFLGHPRPLSGGCGWPLW